MQRWLVVFWLVSTLYSIGCGGSGNTAPAASSSGESGASATTASANAGGAGTATTPAGSGATNALGGYKATAPTASVGGATTTGGFGTTNTTGGFGTTNTTGGFGTTNATGGFTATTGNSAPETLLHGVDPNTEYGACASYMIRQMVRRAECEKGSIDPNNFAMGLDVCPDAFFSAGSNVTVAQVLACAEKWRAHPCEDYNRMIYPECDLSPGDVALGEPCLFPRQCQTTACASTGGRTCGQCVEFAGVGVKCHDADPPVACAHGLECTGSGCQVPPEFNLPAGSRCERLGQCESGYLCLPDPTDGLERCLEPRPEGDSCAEVQFCVKGFYCDSALLTCNRRPEENEACANDSLCARGFYCNASTRCERRHSAGQTCTRPTTYTDVVAECAEGLECFCSDDACSTGTCYERRMPTEPCDDGVGRCGKGLLCSGGLCVESGLIGLFESACRG